MAAIYSMGVGVAMPIAAYMFISISTSLIFIVNCDGYVWVALVIPIPVIIAAIV